MNTLASPAEPLQTTGPAQRPRVETPSLLPLLLLFAALKLALGIGITLLSQHAGYGIHRDELYYLVCGHRLALGYVDQPPLVALQARLAEVLFGYRHLWAFRLLPGLAGALTVILTGLLTDALGGTRRAVGLAMLFMLTVPVFIATQSVLSMNAWEPVFWMGMVWAMLRLLVRPQATGWWLLLGASAGLGVENKVSIVFFMAALILAWAVTPARRLFRTRGFFLAVAVTVLLAVPNFWWQATHGFPTWEWLRDVQHSDKNMVLSLPQVLGEQVLMLSPFDLFLWLPGLLWLLFARAARPWRSAGFLYLFFFGIMLLLHAKDYYIAPVYPMLFAAGAVFWTDCVAGSRARMFALAGYAGVATAAVVLTAPMAVPILPPAEFLQFRRAIHLGPMESEQHPGTSFPEFFGDHLGWQELADEVARVYHALPPDQQRQTGIVAGNYGQAGALDILGRPLGLPATISGHQNYWLWGPQGYTGGEMIVVSPESMSVMLRYYRSCTVAAWQSSPYTMPWEQRTIYVCHDRLQPYATSWNDEKLYR